MSMPVRLHERGEPANLGEAEVWAVSQSDNGHRIRLKVVDAAHGLVESPSEIGRWDFEVIWPATAEWWESAVG